MRAPPFVAARKNVVEVLGFFAKKKKENPVQNASTSTPHPYEKNRPLVAEPADNRPTPVNGPCANLGYLATHGGTSAASDVLDLTEPDISRKPTHQEDFEHLIREIDKDINQFESGNVQEGLSNTDGREHTTAEVYRPSVHSNPATNGKQAQPTQPTPLCDITNHDPHALSTQA